MSKSMPTPNVKRSKLRRHKTLVASIAMATTKLVCKCTNAQMRKCSNAQMRKCSMRKCTNARNALKLKCTKRATRVVQTQMQMQTHHSLFAIHDRPTYLSLGVQVSAFDQVAVAEEVCELRTSEEALEHRVHVAGLAEVRQPHYSRRDALLGRLHRLDSVGSLFRPPVHTYTYVHIHVERVYRLQTTQMNAKVML